MPLEISLADIFRLATGRDILDQLLQRVPWTPIQSARRTLLLSNEHTINYAAVRTQSIPGGWHRKHLASLRNNNLPVFVQRNLSPEGIPALPARLSIARRRRYFR